MDASVEAIILIDQQGVVSAFNRSAERLFGHTASEIVGRNVKTLMPEPYRSAHDAYLNRYAETGVPHIIGVGREVRGQRKDGSVFPAFLSVGQIAGTGTHRYVGMIRDVTTERQTVASLQAERDSAKANQLAEQQARHLQERLTHVARMATMGEMAAGIAHELNQPLSAIATYARACERFLTSAQPDMEETLTSIREIANEALRAGDIIRHLRQVLGNRPSAHADLDVNALVKDLMVLAQADARVNRTRIELKLTPGLAHISGDPAQLQQLILSLVRNAVEALAHGAATERCITIATSPYADSHVELSVADNGPGVDPSIVDTVFAPFVTTKPQGTGLGLSISETIARAHGGTVGYRSLAPHGACFFVRLPVTGNPA